MLDFALDVDVSGGADDVGQTGRANFGADHLGRERDRREEPRELARRVRETALFLQDVLLNRCDHRSSLRVRAAQNLGELKPKLTAFRITQSVCQKQLCGRNLNHPLATGAYARPVGVSALTNARVLRLRLLQFTWLEKTQLQSSRFGLRSEEYPCYFPISSRFTPEVSIR
ncbi:hypothetical protein DSM3645_03953 [Blastopirellula marina DSM 3645]|uniref:Uncharacterized protein n=1 Tax=Blastopirellula marina DSM 3645 TaxID=314230 RepID=A3ZV62_9BACT|nr:hypothetical protein DSM3645_03953 [Blastopirellula marina DSM 3645]